MCFIPALLYIICVTVLFTNTRLHPLGEQTAAAQVMAVQELHRHTRAENVTSSVCLALVHWRSCSCTLERSNERNS